MNKLFAYILLNNSFLGDMKESIFKYYEIDSSAFKDIETLAKKLVHKDTGKSVDNVRSIFTAIHSNTLISEAYFRESCFTVSDDLFPSRNKIRDVSLLDRYEKQVEKLFNMKKSLHDFNTNLFYLQKFYLSNFRAYEDTLEVLSQFEWIKSLSAISQVLHSTTDNADHPFLILCGDLSGIQDFIYDIHSSKAYKSLKGRSFYLQLLVDAIIESILDALSLSISNVIYSSGGKFYLLLPNNEYVLNKLDLLKEKIQHELSSKDYLGIYVCMDWIPFGIGSHYEVRTNAKQNNGSHITGLGDLWKSISDKAASGKSRKFDKILVNNFNNFFTQDSDNYNGNNTATCAVTGVPVEMKPEHKLNPHDHSDKTYVSFSVLQQISLGKKLRDCTILTSTKRPQKDSFNPMNLGLYYSLTNSNEIVEDCCTCLLNPITEQEFVQFFVKTKSAKFMFYGGNKQVLKDTGEIASLEDVASPLGGYKLEKIGVLKMDVDNLGQLFTKGMKDNSYRTFAAMSDLSNRLDWFFSGYINAIRDSDYFKDYVNVIYSGGDDICAIGKWDKVLEFATKVRKDFRTYIGNGEHISLSAGYVICNPKFPIRKAIELAEDELDNAKNYKLNTNNHQPDKNSISLFGTSIYWQATVPRNREWEIVLKLSGYFRTKLTNNEFSKGFIYQLHSYDLSRKSGQIDWQWRSAYYFAKMQIRNKTTKEEIKNIRNAIISGQLILESMDLNIKMAPNRFFDLLIVALKLADYQTR